MGENNKILIEKDWLSEIDNKHLDIKFDYLTNSF